MPRNRELMRVFKDVGFVEQLGSGMSRILKVYPQSIFQLTPNFITVTFLFESATMNVLRNVSRNVPRNELEQAILDCISEDDKITAKALSDKFSITTKTIQRSLKVLKDAGVIRRVGSTKAGRWEITK